MVLDSFELNDCQATEQWWTYIAIAQWDRS